MLCVEAKSRDSAESDCWEEKKKEKGLEKKVRKHKLVE